MANLTLDFCILKFSHSHDSSTIPKSSEYLPDIKYGNPPSQPFQFWLKILKHTLTINIKALCEFHNLP